MRKANAPICATCSLPSRQAWTWKQLRLRAEALLIELRCADDGGAKFAQAAAQWLQLPQWPARR